MYSVILSKDHSFLCTLQCTDVQKHFCKSMEANGPSFWKPLAEAQSQQHLKAKSNHFKWSLPHLLLSEIQYALYSKYHCSFNL